MYLLDCVVFDLGGVLVELNGPAIRPEWFPANAEPQDLDRWLHNPLIQDFEKGRIPANEFADLLVAELQLSITAQEWLHHFKAWPRGLFPGVHELLTTLKQLVRIAVLSNTNEIHWPRMLDEFGLKAFSDDLYASHLMGMAKPDPAIFRELLAQLGLQANAVLFLDDNIANVEAAQGVGLLAEHIRTDHTIQNALRPYLKF